MADIVSRMAGMDVKETIPSFGFCSFALMEEEEEEKEVNMIEKQEDSEDSVHSVHSGELVDTVFGFMEEEEEEEREEEEEIEAGFFQSPRREDKIMISDEYEYEDEDEDEDEDEPTDREMEEAQSKVVPLQRNNSEKKTGNELMSEMASYLKTLEEGADQKQKEEADSKLHALLSSLTPMSEDTKESALNDEDEIEGDMDELVSRLSQHSSRYCILLVFSALHGRWNVHRRRRYYQECARKGLAKFNELNVTNFVVDKSTCRANWCLHMGEVNYWHVNFEATDDVSKETCKFFAELVDKVGEEMSLKVCCKLEFDAAGVDNCWFCKRKHKHEIFHPKGVRLVPDMEWKPVGPVRARMESLIQKKWSMPL